MKRTLSILAAAIGVLASSTAFAQAPAAAPSGSTGLCKDGSYTSNDTKKGACAGHKGVRDWFAANPPLESTKTSAPAAASTPGTAATKAMPTATAAKPGAPATSAAPAAGGGPGQVWVNTSSKVYHCAGTKYYGKTKHGEYMTEAAAKAAGSHADHGKACS